MPEPQAPAEETLAQRLLRGDKRALARAISLVEDEDPAGWELVREVYPHTGNAQVVGFTGPPGAGKSTLIGALVKHQRALDRSWAAAQSDLADSGFRAYLELSLRRLDEKEPAPPVSREEFLAQTKALDE